MKIFTRLFVCSAVAASVLAYANLAEAAPPKVGKPVVYSMKTTTGKTISNKSLSGKIVVLDFWATWCGPCKAASPTMQAIHNKYGKKGVVVIGADVWERQTGPGLAANYAKEHKYSYTFTYGNDELAKSWGIQGIPQFYVIDKKGRLAAEYTGFPPTLEKDLTSVIEKLLKKK